MHWHHTVHACVVRQVADPENPTPKTEERDEVTFEGPVDSVYLNATKDYVELDVGTGAAVAISSSGWEDVVVVSFLRLQCTLPGQSVLLSRPRPCVQGRPLGSGSVRKASVARRNSHRPSGGPGCPTMHDSPACCGCA